MTANDLVLSEAASAALIADVRRFGAAHVETGGFLLAPRDVDEVTIVALADTAGIIRRRDLFQVSDLALDRLSECDVEHGLSVQGFVTTIVPHFAAPPQDPARWGWWRYEGAWIPLAPPCRSSTPVSVITFDEGGVDGA